MIGAVSDNPIGIDEMPPKPENMNPTVTPQYSKLAVMPNGLLLQNRAYLKTTEIESFLKQSPTYQTINRMLQGKPGNYTGVHRVFSALNVKMGGVLRRYDEVFIYEEKKSSSPVTTPDPLLDDCAVFPNLEEYISRLSSSASIIGDEATVATRQVEHMVAGRPVARNLVLGVFEAVNTRMASRLVLGNEVFG